MEGNKSQYSHCEDGFVFIYVCIEVAFAGCERFISLVKMYGIVVGSEVSCDAM